MKTYRTIICLFFLVFTVTLAKAQEVVAYSNPVHIFFKLKDVIAPEISLYYQNNGVLNADGKIEVLVKILDPSGISTYSVNNTPFDGNAQETVMNTFFFFPNSEISISASDASNNVKDKVFTVKGPAVEVVTPTPTPSPAIALLPLGVGMVSAPALGDEYANSLPKYTALVIGISNYKYSSASLPKLENPVKDAQSVYDLLTTKYLFDTASSQILKDPTRQEIIDALEKLSAEMSPNDNLLVFYAGHGYYDKSKQFGYWLPSDSKSTTRGEWIANSQIKDYITAIPSKHTLLITDACFGGSIFKSRAVDATTFLKIHDLYKDASKKAITSGNLTEVPDQSLFLRQLLKKLGENEDDYLPAQKLYSRIYEPITNNSTAIPQIGVIQGAGDDGGDFIFVKRK